PAPDAPPGHDGGGAEGRGSTDDAGPPRAASRRRKRWIPPQVRWTITAVVLFFVLEYLVLPELANARKSLNLLGRVNVVWLVAGVVFEGAALAAYAQLTHTVLSPGAPSRFRLFRVNMSSLAVSHVIPGGTAPGTAVAYRLLTDLGVSGSTSAFALATQGVGSAVVLNALLWLSLLISVPLTGYNPLYGFAAIAGVILLGLFAGVVMLLTRGKRQAADRLTRLASHLPLVNPTTVAGLVQTVADRLEVLLRNRALLQRALWWAAANWLLDAASLWVFVFAFGHAVSPVDLLVAYGLANVLAVIPITPGGLGVVEGVLIPTLVGFHVPKAVAILGVLSYRLVNFWLPIPAGGIAYLSLRFGPSARRHRSHSSVGPSHSAR
ncbi:MAG: lysylphosphatidylglycerol synthase transmembrane domain-containing protein, partial [Acidimicrobiales bacterium]